MIDLHMTVFKPKGRRYYVAQWVDPVSGRKRTRSTGCEKKRPAERHAGQLEKELREGTYRDRERITWDEFRDRYEREVLPGKAEKTSNLAGTTFNAVERIIGPKKLATLDAAQISRFASKLRDEGRPETTVKCYLAHLKAALRWAYRQGMLAQPPRVEMPKRATGMKGRPITGEEFERMLAAVPDALVAGIRDDKTRAQAKTDLSPETVESWRYLLRGLWWSGLRLSEALDLHWEDDRKLCVDFTGRRPMFCIQAAGQKSHKAEVLPMAPEFAEFLQRTPQPQRTGYVFDPLPIRHTKPESGRLRLDTASKVICRIGRTAGVKVAEKAGKVKHASAHDCRRAFGFRWAQRVMPAVLQQLMRHASIQTTMEFYVGRNAESAADALWNAVGEAGSGGEMQRPANTGPESTPTGEDGLTQTVSPEGL